MAQPVRYRKSKGEETKKSPLLDAFGEQYLLISWDGGYCLYDYKRECKRAKAQYLGQFYISNGRDKYVFHNERYENVQELVEAMDKYNATLPFSPEIYNPTNRKQYNVQCAITDYLTGIGFKYNNESKNSRFYSYSDVFGNYICEIELATVFDTSKGFIRRKIVTTDRKKMWQEAPFRDLESAIGAVNSVIASYLGIVQSQLMNTLKALTTSRAAIMITNTYNVGDLAIYTEDATKQTIEYLETELKRLKRE